MSMLSQDDLDKLVPAESRMFASPIQCNPCPVTNFCPNRNRRDRNCSKQGSRMWAARWQSSSAFRAARRARWSGEKCDLRRKQRPPVANVKPQLRAAIEGDQLTRYKMLYAEHGAGRTNLAYGCALKDAG